MSSSLTPMSEVELAGWRTIVSSVCFVSGINKPVKVRVCLASSLSLSHAGSVCWAIWAAVRACAVCCVNFWCSAAGSIVTSPLSPRLPFFAAFEQMDQLQAFLFKESKVLLPKFPRHPSSMALIVLCSLLFFFPRTLRWLCQRFMLTFGKFVLFLSYWFLF